MDIPEEIYICKYCSYCGCYSEDAEGKAICYDDIHEYVNVNSPACCDFDYDDTFVRT